MIKSEENIRVQAESKIHDLEIQLGRKGEELETFQFNNNRLTKRVENLMNDINNMVKKNQLNSSKLI